MDFRTDTLLRWKYRMEGKTIPQEERKHENQDGRTKREDALNKTSRPFFSFGVAKRIVVTVLGGTLLIGGLALTVLPGPAFVVIPIGLAVLATEYAWARRWLRKAEEYPNQLATRKEKR